MHSSRMGTAHYSGCLWFGGIPPVTTPRHIIPCHLPSHTPCHTPCHTHTHPCPIACWDACSVCLEIVARKFSSRQINSTKQNLQKQNQRISRELNLDHLLNSQTPWPLHQNVFCSCVRLHAWVILPNSSNLSNWTKLSSF